jgi:hypothetical protein
MAFTFKLELADGTPADPPVLQTAVPNWEPGNTIPLGVRTLRVVGVRQDEPDENPVLVVEDTDGGNVCTASGQPMGWSNVIRRGLHKAVENAKLRDPRPRFHDLRHTFASLLIGQGADVVYVSRAMGHADPSLTLRIYSHLWAGREHGEHFRQLLDTSPLRAFPEDPKTTKAPPFAGLSPSGRYWARTSDPQLVELVLSQLS